MVELPNDTDTDRFVAAAKLSIRLSRNFGTLRRGCIGDYTVKRASGGNVARDILQRVEPLIVIDAEGYQIFLHESYYDFS